MLLRSLLALAIGALYTAASQSLLLCLIIGSASVFADSARNAANGIHLDEDLYNRALAHAGLLEQQTQNGITERLRKGEVEALYSVAKSMNDSGDKISSVMIWHALADDGSEGDDYEGYDEAEGYDYEGHVPSAMALGFSYYEVDKPRSLHYFLMATSKKGMPHQTAMFNTGRLYLELEDPSSALAYIRACATLDEEHPAHARPQLSITCRKAYDTLSTELIGHSDMGLEEAVECFPYASIDDFPQSNTKEFQVFHGAMSHLDKYMEIVRANRGEVIGSSARTRAVKHLAAAMETLMIFQRSNRENMSKLQLFLVGYILERITNLAIELERGSGEL